MGNREEADGPGLREDLVSSSSERADKGTVRGALESLRRDVHDRATTDDSRWWSGECKGSAPPLPLLPSDPAFRARVSAARSAERLRRLCQVEVSGHLPPDERVRRLLDTRPQAGDANESLRKARESAVVVAQALDAEREPIQNLFYDLLRSKTPINIDELITRIDAIEHLPGFPRIDSFEPDRFCDFAVDAAVRGRTARDRYVSPMPIFAYTKTGSSFLTMVMSDLMDVPWGVASLNYEIAVRAWLSFAASFPFSLHDHMWPTQQNIDLLQQAGVSKVVLHVRDPRQVVVSLAHHVLLYRGASQNRHIERVVDEYGFDALLDRMSSWMIQYRNWLIGWKSLTRKNGIDLLITKYESMLENKDRFFNDILDYFVSPSTLHDKIARSLSKRKRLKQREAMFRLGTADEWKTVLSRRQIGLIETHCAGAFTALYGF
jgi:hypothetical protein